MKLAQIRHFFGRSLQLPVWWWPIPQYIIPTELGPASQYLSITLTILPYCKPDVESFFASASPLTVMTMADPCLSPVFCCFLKRFSFIRQQGKAFSYMPVEELNSYLSNVMLLITRYLSSKISCILWQYQFSNTSIPIIAWSTNFLARIYMLDKRRMIV